MLAYHHTKTYAEPEQPRNNKCDKGFIRESLKHGASMDPILMVHLIACNRCKLGWYFKRTLCMRHLP